jgi:hypothetical protein
VTAMRHMIDRYRYAGRHRNRTTIDGAEPTSVRRADYGLAAR